MQESAFETAPGVNQSELQKFLCNSLPMSLLAPSTTRESPRART
jgi:hypothetical protein